MRSSGLRVIMTKKIGAIDRPIIGIPSGPQIDGAIIRIDLRPGEAYLAKAPRFDFLADALQDKAAVEIEILLLAQKGLFVRQQENRQLGPRGAKISVNRRRNLGVMEVGKIVEIQDPAILDQELGEAHLAQCGSIVMAGVDMNE